MLSERFYWKALEFSHGFGLYTFDFTWNASARQGAYDWEYLLAKLVKSSMSTHPLNT